MSILEDARADERRAWDAWTKSREGLSARRAEEARRAAKARVSEAEKEEGASER